ncbi:hypothetical protein [Caloramator sp. E03]|nr:hypothetical protein [Caloramator sp. E03]
MEKDKSKNIIENNKDNQNQNIENKSSSDKEMENSEYIFWVN